MKRRIPPVLVVCLLIILIGGAGLGVHFVQKYKPTKEQMNPVEYYGSVAENEAVIVIGTQILEQRALVSGDQVYLPISVVDESLNERLYWDSANNQILYATPTELITTPASEEAGTEVWHTADTVYLKVDFVRQHTDLDVSVLQNPNRVVIQKDFSNVSVVTAQKSVAVRYQGGIKSPVLTYVSAGETMFPMEEYDNWYQVATRDGFIGYVAKKEVTAPSVAEVTRDFVPEEYNYLKVDGKVNLVWHQVTVAEANAGLTEAIANMTGVNVISPTWYAVTDNNGNMTDLSSAEYVQEAHSKGLQVWGLVDNFSPDFSTETLLSNTAARQNLIGQLVASAVNVGMDGINVDFESLTEGAGVHFLEFLRELSIECHKNNLILSVDNPVPADFTSHYDRTEQGKIVDYIIIMGYDEHYVGSQEAGSVASLPWVEQGITDTLEEVPADRVINGMPFYTRLWKTMAGTLSSEAISMTQAEQVLTENHVETYWDTNVSQNVGIFETADASYQIWLEDNQSIAEKTKLAVKYNLAGVAAWKLGFEDSSIWQTITDNLY